MTWQPIETAPKDGRRIKVRREDPVFGTIEGTAEWFSEPIIGSGWLARGDGRAVADGLGLAFPDEWMPLPEPPEVPA